MARVSPKSRGRKKKSKRGRSAGNDPNAVLREIVSAYQAVVDEPNPLDVEELTSSLIGSWQQAGDDGEILGLATIRYAETRPAPASLAWLRAMEAVGTDELMRQEAAAGAAALVDQGVPDPPWAATIGRVTTGPCWLAADAYRDSATLLCEFGYGADRHGLIALINFNLLGGAIDDVTIIDEPDAALRDLRKQAMTDGMLTVEQIPPHRARQLIEYGLDAMAGTGPDEVSEDFTDFRALALARCRALPEPDQVPEPPEVSEAERDAIVARFLAEAADLPAGDTTRQCARMIVDFGCDYDQGQPMRVGPAKTQIFLRGWLPNKVIMDDERLTVMSQVLRAWVRWAADRNELPEPAVAALVELTDEGAGQLAETYADDVRDSPTRALLDDLDLDSTEDRQDALDRRMFAMPYSGTWIGDEEYPELDPADPDQRRLLIIGEHPEFHEALLDPSFDGEIDGVNPRLHVTIDEIVLNQLWDNDPPQTWAAAKRLVAGGVDRLDVIHQLGGVVASHVYQALRGEQADNDALCADLDALMPPRP
jgi:hypothetical protein